MCGRYTLATDPENIESWFELEQAAPAFQVSYNIPPASDVPVIWQKPGDGLACTIMHWGLIPHWAKTTTSKYKMINAKAETLAEKPAFRDAYRKRRCLIPTTGFYEWHATAQGKQPYYIGKPDHALFAFAGLWEYWEGEKTINSFTIITTVANKMVSSIHERMPVIIGKDYYREWLDSTNHEIGSLDKFLIPEDWSGLAMYPVSTEVNNPRHDNPGLLTPLER